jgi:hypothetical protein
VESPYAYPSLSPSDERFQNRPAYIAFDADEKHLVLARSEEIVWKSVTGESSVLLPCAFEAAPVAVAISSDGARFGWVDKLGTARICEAATKRVRQWPVKNATRIAFLGAEWCVVDGEGDCQFFNVGTGAEATLVGLSPLKAAEFSMQAKGSLAAAAIRGGGITLGLIRKTGEALEWRPLTRLGTQVKGEFSGLRFAGHDRWLGAVARDGQLHLWDLKSLSKALAAASCLPDGLPVPAP